MHSKSVMLITNEEKLDRERLLVKIALNPTAEKWGDWLEMCPDLEGLSSLEMRLLPFVFSELRKQGVSGYPNENRIYGLMKKHWYNNKIRDGIATAVIKDLEEIGITAKLIKGLGLLRALNWNFGSRPTRDIDIWVLPHNFEAAYTYLSSNVQNRADPLDKRLHGVSIFYNNVTSVDLHQYSSAGENAFEGSIIEASFASADTSKGALTIALLNSLFHEPPPLEGSRFMNAFVDWHRSGIPWEEIKPIIQQRNLTPLLYAHLKLHEDLIQESVILKEAFLSMSSKRNWTNPEQKNHQRLRSWINDHEHLPTRRNRWRWTSKGMPIWRQDLESIKIIFTQAQYRRFHPIRTPLAMVSVGGIFLLLRYFGWVLPKSIDPLKTLNYVFKSTENRLRRLWRRDRNA